MVYGTYNELVFMGFHKPSNSTGGPHIVVMLVYWWVLDSKAFPHMPKQYAQTWWCQVESRYDGMPSQKLAPEGYATLAEIKQLWDALPSGKLT